MLRVCLTTREQVDVRLVFDPRVEATAEQIGKHLQGEDAGIDWPDQPITATVRPLSDEALLAADDAAGQPDRLGALVEDRVQSARRAAWQGAPDGADDAARALAQARAQRRALKALDDEEREALQDYRRWERARRGAIVDAALVRLSGITVEDVRDGEPVEVDSGALPASDLHRVFAALGPRIARHLIDEIEHHVRRLSELPQLGKACSPPRSG